ncbi:IS3 family transposase, partial [Arachidicoccus rhizosphaerae]
RKGIQISLYKSRIIMQENNLKAIQPRSFVPKTTNSRHRYAKSPNLLKDRAMPVKMNEVWVGDITYIPLKGGKFCYLAVWLDLYSRRIIGWTLSTHMREEIVITAFEKAVRLRNKIPAGLIVHSDRGGQYAGNGFRSLLNKKQVSQSMSDPDNPYDNAFMESCFSRFKAELMQENKCFESVEDAQTQIREYIDQYYNVIRLHSSLDYNTPIEFETEKLIAV